MLPSPYNEWMIDALGGEIPEEPRSTCSQCAMADASERNPFSANLKCCTYLPQVPNFLVGAVLCEEGGGAVSVHDRIDRKSGVTPLGLGITAAYGALYELASGPAFGRSPALLCPHFSTADGTCGIWSRRNSVCSTFYCKTSHGARSAEFWRGLRDLLTAVEHGLSWWCVVKLCGDVDALRLLREQRPPREAVANELTGAELGAPYTGLWGSWIGREREFFQECWRLVQDVSWSEVVERSGPQVSATLGSVRLSYTRASLLDVPSDLIVAPFNVAHCSDSGIQLETHSALDRLVIAPGLLRQVLSLGMKASQGSGVAWESELDAVELRQLVDWGLLIQRPPSSSTQPDLTAI